MTKARDIMARSGLTAWTAACVLTAGAAMAQTEAPVKICNQTQMPADCFIATGGDKVAVTGSHRIEAGACREFGEVASPVLYHCVQKRYDDEAKRWLTNGTWDGETTYCVPLDTSKFELVQVADKIKNCEEHGLTSIGFETPEDDDGAPIEIMLED